MARLTRSAREKAPASSPPAHATGSGRSDAIAGEASSSTVTPLRSLAPLSGTAMPSGPLPGYFDRRFGPLAGAPLGQRDDPEERAAEAFADRAARQPAPDPGTGHEPASGAGNLDPGIRHRLGPTLGLRLGDVRVHDGPAARDATRAVGARAMTRGAEIWLGAGESPRDLRLMAHELAHVAQGAGPDGDPRRLRRQPANGAGSGDTTPVCRAPDGSSFNLIGPRPAPDPPATQPTEVSISLPGLGGAPARTETVVLQEPVQSATPITYYAIPIALTSLARPGEAAVCTLEPDASSEDRTATSPPAFPGVPQVSPATVTAGGQTLTPERVTDAFVIVSEYHHLAVGAGATTLLETAQGVRLIDAGVGTDGGADISATIADRVGQLLRGRPITEVMITHLHADHTNLLPRLAERFPIGRIRVNALQFADPRFQQLLRDVAGAQARGVRDRAGAEFDAARASWEAGEGSRIADTALREQAFQAARERYVADALQRLTQAPTQVELLIPNGGRLVAGSAPMGSLRDLTTATTDPVIEGLRRAATPGGVADTALTDPAMGQQLAAQRERATRDPAARVPDPAVDTASTSYIIDLPAGNRLIVVPDVRTDDLRRTARDSSGARRANLEAELTRLGHPARFQAWNMTHHMQSGWVAGGAPHIVGAAELDGFIALLQNIREAQAAARQPGATAPADMVVVSAQHEALTRSLVNPAMVWFLRACGFEVFLAASGRDVRLIEATTASGQRIAGVSGLPAEGLGPTDPLLTQSEAAIRYLDARIQDQQARRAPARMRTADKQALVADRTTQIARLTAARDAIGSARQTYIETVSREIWRGVHDTSRPAVAPDPAQPQPPAMQAAEQALRTAMQAPELTDFTPPRPGETPVISDTALVLLRRAGDAPLDTAARRVMEANQRADLLRRRLQAGERPADTRAELTEALNALRDAIREQLPNAPEASRPVLQEELVHTQREIESLLQSREGEILFSREPGTGRLIENRVVQAPAREATPADRVRSGAATAGRFLGAIMVYQTIRESEDLERRVQTGEATGSQGVIGLLHSAHGLTIGLRMMSLVHVHPGEFVVMSVLHVSEAVAGEYDTPEARTVAISRAALSEGISLFLLALSQAMMRSGNPYVVAAGFGVMFLTQPIVSFLDYVGVFDAIERASAFLPAEVTAANQHLRDLMQEYRAIIGAMQLAARTDEELRGLGASDPAALRTSSAADIAANRERARDKERDLLSAFEEGYTRARTDYAGLFELDMLRNQFLALREQAHRGDAAAAASASSALSTFERIDRALSMEGMTAEEVREMPQWPALEEAVEELEELLQEEDKDWEAAREKHTEVQQMLRNARYRINPAAAGMRSAPLMPPGVPGRATYEETLRGFEMRLMRSQAALFPGMSAGAFAEGTASAAAVEQALAAYERLVASSPERPDAVALYRDSANAAVEYPAFVRGHPDYARFLDRLQAAEMALQSMAVRMAQEAPVGPPTESAASLPARIRTAVSRRRDQLGLLFLDEAARAAGTARRQETARLAPLLGEAPGTRPLTEEERAAVSGGNLEEAGAQLSTVSNRLEQVDGFSIPTAPDGIIGGVFRLVGTIESIELLITSIPTLTIAADENVLVGRAAGPAQGMVSSRGHYDAVPIVPLNAAAVGRLGGPGIRRVPRYTLQPVRLRELTAEPVPPGPVPQPAAQP